MDAGKDFTIYKINLTNHYDFSGGRFRTYEEAAALATQHDKRVF